MKLNDALIILACSLIVLWAVVSNAQTPDPPADVVLSIDAGVYPIGCHSADDGVTAELCFARVDLPTALELGCAEAAPNTAIHTTITVPATPGDNAVIKCYAVTAGTLALVSDYSWNSGTINFSAPGVPRIVATMRAMHRKRLYLSCSQPVFTFDG